MEPLYLHVEKESPVMLTYVSAQAISALPKVKQAPIFTLSTNLTELKS